MKAVVNKYAEITPTFFGLIEFEEHKDEIFGSCSLIKDGILYTKVKGEWILKYRIHQSLSHTIYFEATNRDLIIGKMHSQGFRVMKIQDYFEKEGKRPPQLVLEGFEEILHELTETENLENLLKNLKINLNTQ